MSFPVAFVPNFSFFSPFLSILLSSNVRELSFPPELQSPRDQRVKSIFLAVGALKDLEGDERKDQDVTRIENDE